MPLTLDISGDSVQLWVQESDRHLEPNVVYGLQQIPYYRAVPCGVAISHYEFKWYDIYLALSVFQQLGFKIDVTERFNEKWQDWHRWQQEEDSGVVLSGRDQLLPFQHRNVLFCRYRKSAYIGDQMGLGKTITGVAVGFDKLRAGHHDHVVVVCRANAAKTWLNMISSSVPPPYNAVTFVTGTETVERWNTPTPWHLVTYEKARDEVDVLESLSDQRGRPLWRSNLLIADEIHAAKRSVAYLKGKGRTSVKQTAALQKIARMSTGTIGLSGQKLFRLEHLYEVMESIDQKFFGSFEEFGGRYCAFDQTYKAKIVGYFNEGELARKMPIIMTAYKKSDVVAQLPPRTNEVRWIEPSAEEIKRYRQFVTTGLSETADRDGERRGMIQNHLTLTLNCKRYCGSPSLINEKWPKIGSKLTELLSLLDGNDQKVVIFSQYADVCDIIVEAIGREKCFTFYRNDDSTSWSDWLLQDDKLYFVMSTKGKECISLHGIDVDGVWKTGASTLIMVDELFDPSDNEQVMDRIHRIIKDEEQMKRWNAHVITLRCCHTYEEYIAKMLEERTDFADRLRRNLVSYAELKRMLLGE